MRWNSVLMLLDQLRRRAEPVGRDQLLGEIEEVLREEPLPAVDIDDALVERQVGRGGGDRGGEIFWAAASRLNSASQWSKLPVLRQFGLGERPRSAPRRDQRQQGEGQGRSSSSHIVVRCCACHCSRTARCCTRHRCAVRRSSCWPCGNSPILIAGLVAGLCGPGNNLAVPSRTAYFRQHRDGGSGRQWDWDRRRGCQCVW